MHASEIRQIAAHSEVLIISDTAPPIRAAYPPLAVMRYSHQARRKGSPRELHLGDIDADFLLTEAPPAKSKQKEDEQAVVNKVSETVDKVMTDTKLEEILAPSTASEAEMENEAKADPETESSRHVGALDEITFDLRFSLADQWERSVSPF
jgi:uncharacterized protein (UPF0147 family)